MAHLMSNALAVQPVARTASCDEATPPHSATLNTRTGLQNAAGKTDLYRRVLEAFLLNDGDSAMRLKSALEGDARTEAQRIAHTIKSVAAAVGADGLRASARQLEIGIANGESMEGLQIALSDFEQTLAMTLNAIRETLREIASADTEA